MSAQTARRAPDPFKGVRCVGQLVMKIPRNLHQKVAEEMDEIM